MDTQPIRHAVWYQATAGVSENEVAALREALARQALRIYPSQDVPPSAPGLLLFSTVSEDVLDTVALCSRDGFERVLAIAWGETRRVDIWRLLHAGAADVVRWRELDNPAEVVAALLLRWDLVDGLMNAPVVRDNIIGRSRAWMSAMRQVVEVACFSDASVLITGESGTGKELAARLIHTLDNRPNKQQLILVDCTTVVPDLSGSEFFGHERGAFTNAVAARDGAFALADRGTLFLDEIGDLRPTLQAELLRVIQEHTYKRIGSNTWRETNFRLVCATNCDLQHAEREGLFRRDLYYRIASCTISLPPLDQRREDILPLAHFFLRQMYPHQDPPSLCEEVSDYLLSREYKGNVRELRQLVQRLAWRHSGGGIITPGTIPEDDRPDGHVRWTMQRDVSYEQVIRRSISMGKGLKEITREAAELAVRIALEDAQGSVRLAAERLGVTSRALQLRRAQGSGSGSVDISA